VLPQWVDNENIRFIRHDAGATSGFDVYLMGMNLMNRNIELLADLSDDGKLIVILDYTVVDETIYYCDSGHPERMGFYSAKIDGGKSLPKQMLSTLKMREDNSHPGVRGLYSVQVTQDGRWACLTLLDNRLISRDFPFADGLFHARVILGPNASVEELEEAAIIWSQPDPGSAVSSLTGRTWIPSHNVILYDLVSDEIVDPFINRSLHPDVVVATGATFAPDGKSLLCMVLGDGDVWTSDSFFNVMTLYQIRLDDGSFDAVRVYKKELQDLSFPEKLTWLENNSLLISAWDGRIPPLNPVYIVIPAAFERFLD